MRITHVAATRNSESSAAWRILTAQRQAGIEASALVHINSNNMPNTEVFPDRGVFRNYKSAAIKNSVIRKLTRLNNTKLPWSYSYFSGTNFENILHFNPEVINIHWIPSVLDLSKIHKINKPIVITLHDVWPLTGGCHCNLDCGNWKSGCSNCPQNSQLEKYRLSAEYNWQVKYKSFKKINNLSAVAPSNWMGAMARESPLFEDRVVSVIPNCADSKIFFPREKLSCKRELGISDKKFNLLYVVSGNINQHHKGIDLLKSVLRNEKISFSNFQLLVVGQSQNDFKDIQGVEIKYLGEIKSQEQMSLIYNASDLMISTSRQDNLPNTLVEASLCGLPIVAFDVGGISDIVQVNLNGRLVAMGNITEMARVIFEMSQIAFDPGELSASALKRFSFENCARNYLNHYLKIVSVD